MMNTKTIIGVVVGGFLIFLWQFLSWAMLNLHRGEQKHTPNQDAILEFLSTQLSEDGTYFLPTYADGATMEEQQKVMESSEGKPWAQISFHKSLNTAMGMNMFRGFLTDIVAVFLLVWLLGKIPECTMGTSIMASVAVGVIGYLTTEYTNSIWFETNSMSDLIDALVSWALCGTWLGYWINR